MFSLQLSQRKFFEPSLPGSDIALLLENFEIPLLLPHSTLVELLRLSISLTHEEEIVEIESSREMRRHIILSRC
jgi:hypothetical protein